MAGAGAEVETGEAEAEVAAETEGATTGAEYRRDSHSPPNDRETHRSRNNAFDRGSNRSLGYHAQDRGRHSSSHEKNSPSRKYSPIRSSGNGRQASNDNHRSGQHQQSWKRDENDILQGESHMEVILQGLPLDFHEDNIRTIIETRDIGLESIRVARDRYSGESKGFGFLKFMEPQYAHDFVREFSPSIRMGQNWVKIAFSNNPSNSRETSRRCTECGMMNDAHRDDCRRPSSSKQVAYHALGGRNSGFYANNNIGGNGTGANAEMRPNFHHLQQQQQYRHDHHYPHQQNQDIALAYQSQQLNVGTRDIGTVPNSVLIATDLPPMVNESGIWNALSLLGPLRRVMLARDRQSKISWGYCFAEFSDVQSATEALEKARSTGLTIQKKPVEIHYAHHGSFIPAYAPTQWTIDYGLEGQLAIYWDEQAFLSIYTDPSAASCAPIVPHVKGASSTTAERTEKDELSAFYAVMEDVLQSEPPANVESSIFAVPTPKETASAASVAPTSISTPAVSDLPSIPTTAKIDKVQLAGIAAAQAAEQLAKAEEKKRKAGQGHNQGGQSIIGIGGGGKKVSIQLQKWSSLQAETKASNHDSMEQGVTSASSLLSEAVLSQQMSSSSADLYQQQQQKDELIYDPDELVDLKINACLLCQRRLKSVQDLRKHQSLSDLHKKNLSDRSVVEAALARSRGITITSPSLANNASSSMISPATTKAGGDEEPKYRDRAAERRQIFGQPDYPLPPTPSGRDFGGRAFNASNIYTRGGVHEHQDMIIPEQPTKDGIKEDNIGSRLLKSMGWKEGQGLGKSGEGITVPIQASAYAKGVGIGAGVLRTPDGSNQRSGSGPLGNYAESAKELARRRYEQSQ
ncbi:hypothetical protein FBU30_008510 [Linnemannia zychae]|nr:hypothetical protein FBU30_008510 [Linnemannia zychae]